MFELKLNYGKHSKISNTFLFPVSNLLVFRARIHKMLARIATKKNPDQQSDLDLCCLSRPFCWAIFFFWFGLFFYVQVNSYGHFGMVSSPNHTFSSRGKLD